MLVFEICPWSLPLDNDQLRQSSSFPRSTGRTKAVSDKLLHYPMSTEVLEISATDRWPSVTEGALLKPKANVDVGAETMGNTETMWSCLKASYWNQSQMLTLEQKMGNTETMESCLKVLYWNQNQMLTLGQKRWAILKQCEVVWRRHTEPKAKCWRWSRNGVQHWQNVMLSEGSLLEPKPT